MPYLDPESGKKPKKRSFLAKFGNATLGLAAGVAGIVVYPIALTVSGAAKGMRASNNNPYNLFPLRLIKGIWGFARGSVTGLAKGLLEGFRALFVLPYNAWREGNLSETLGTIRDNTIDDVLGRRRRRNRSNTELEDYDPQQPFHRTQGAQVWSPDIYDYDDEPDPHELINARQSVLHQFPNVGTRGKRSSTEPRAITLKSNYPIHPALSSADIEKINAQLNPSENGTFSVQGGLACFSGPNPGAALAICQNSATFSALQGGYALTFDTNNIKETRAYLRACNEMQIMVTQCTIGEKTYTVASPDMLVMLSPKPTR